MYNYSERIPPILIGVLAWHTMAQTDLEKNIPYIIVGAVAAVFVVWFACWGLCKIYNRQNMQKAVDYSQMRS